MKNIAVDFVILPSEEVINKSIEFNKELAKINEDEIMLNKIDCSPHISLAMGTISETYLSKAKEIMQQASEKFSPISLKITNSYFGKIANGKIVSELQTENHFDIYSLHEFIMNNIKDILVDTKKEDFFFPENINDLTLKWVGEYSENSAFEKFNPHITIGFGEIKKLNEKIEFKANKLALFQLGNYCTCRKLICVVDLQHNS